MSKTKKSTAGGGLQLEGTTRETMEQTKGRSALMPSINAASVIQAYQGNILGSDADLQSMVEGLRDSMTQVNDGDLTKLENMLVAQATALQTMFTNLARRAIAQEYLKNMDGFMSMALKAQSQSRATIATLVDLKYPRQATFIKQANVAHGPQQVNNGTATAPSTSNSPARTEETKADQPELLEAPNGSTNLDRGAEATTTRGDPAMETVGAVNRPQDSRRKSQGRPKR